MGTQLIVLQGTYLESNIEVDKSITIIGRGNPVIDAQGKGKIFTVTANDVINHQD